MTRTLILGTAGHIDHGKTTLVRALTGVDTDRLAEEKARGITIDLGFAELVEGDVRFGVVDVPGHEGFVRNMLAGATGMDAALLVVAADEGVMPQTREHVAILDLLGVTRVVIALTRSDVADPEWAELVEDEVRDLVATTGFSSARIVRTSVPPDGPTEGMDALRAALVALTESEVEDRGSADDLLHLPIDRVFTVKGTGTVVTGTLLGGALRVGDSVAVGPTGPVARVRGLQMHGREVDAATPGARVAVALAGSGVDTEVFSRGQALIPNGGWGPSAMLTARLRVLPNTGWSVTNGQRVRVHLGTAEVMARCVLLDSSGAGRSAIESGESGWAQLRLEAPVTARVGMRFVIRAWSPVTTIAGGVVVESHPPKRSGAAPVELLERRIGSDLAERIEAALEVAGGAGLVRAEVPVRTGLSPSQVERALETVYARGGLSASDDRVFGASVAADAAERIHLAVDRVHAEEPFRPGLEVARVRERLPRGLHPSVADTVLERERVAARIEIEAGIVRRPGFTPVLSEEQAAIKEELAGIYASAALEPPRLTDLPERILGNAAFHTLLGLLVGEGRLHALDDEYRIDAEALDAAIEDVQRELGGREELGPSDFREFIPVSRRWLLPILAYLDRVGVTRFEGGDRSVTRVTKN